MYALNISVLIALLLSTSVSALNEDIEIFSEEEAEKVNPNIEFINNYMQKYDDVVIMPSGLRYRVLKEHEKVQKSPEAESHCDIWYKQKNIYGDVVDTSEEHGKKRTITVTPSKIIKGFGEALQMMEPGDTWEIVIPPNLAHGKLVRGKRMPQGSTLIFEVELVKYEKAKHPYFKREYIMWAFLIAYFCYNYYQSRERTKAVIRRTPVAIESVSGLPGNPEVFMQISVDDTILGRIEMELFKTVCPKTVENFRCLCTGEKGMASGGEIPLHFKGSTFHRIIPNFMCQGGDFTNGNGTGGESIYGKRFDDEFDNGLVLHTEEFLLSMANAGPNTNGSQFFITLAKTPWLDDKHVVFGKVKSGKEIVKAMEAMGSDKGQTRAPVKIIDCGELVSTVEVSS